MATTSSKIVLLGTSQQHPPLLDDSQQHISANGIQNAEVRTCPPSTLSSWPAPGLNPLRDIDAPWGLSAAHCDCGRCGSRRRLASGRPARVRSTALGRPFNPLRGAKFRCGAGLEEADLGVDRAVFAGNDGTPVGFPVRGLLVAPAAKSLSCPSNGKISLVNSRC